MFEYTYVNHFSCVFCLLLRPKPITENCIVGHKISPILSSHSGAGRISKQVNWSLILKVLIMKKLFRRTWWSQSVYIYICTYECFSVYIKIYQVNNVYLCDHVLLWDNRRLSFLLSSWVTPSVLYKLCRFPFLDTLNIHPVLCPSCSFGCIKPWW